MLARQGTCDAHEMLVDAMTGLRGDISKLYDLNRETSRDGAEVKERLSSVEAKLDAWHEEGERQQATLTAMLSSGLSRIEDMVKIKPKSPDPVKRKWGPQHTVALVGSIVGPGGIAAIILIFWK